MPAFLQSQHPAHDAREPPPVDGIFGECGIAEAAEGDGVEPVGVAFDELAKGGLGVVVEELAVGILQKWQRPLQLRRKAEQV